MTDDDTADRVRRAAGGPGVLDDVEAIVTRGRRRRVATWATSAVAVVLVLGLGGVVLDRVTTPTEVRFADGSATDSATAEPSDSGTDGTDGADTAATAAVGARCPTSATVDTPVDDDADVRAVDGWPDVEGEPVATPDGFMAVAVPAPNAAWWSDDGRTWTRQRAEGLLVDVAFDVGVTADGEVVVLDAEQNLWASGDRGRTWHCSSLPDGLAGRDATAIGADERWWYVAGGQGRSVRVTAVARDTMDGLRPVTGDFAVGPPASARHPSVILASGPAGTVVVAGARQVPTVWLVADDLTTTRVDDPFDGGAVTAVSATDDGFIATVAWSNTAGPQLWRSVDGLSWTRAGDARPAPSCARVVDSDGDLLATGGPCDQDGGWEVWQRATGGSWARVDQAS